ncbi:MULTISPECIES: glycoside hydrolase family 3 C-terminal domain-containing protein [unclassified Pedobacter]|uniref:glycoside hydrolase family 3 C-terminal domain-containing protein n=1 Tax=unclassified Pedobacter TaxID=2628915 RepID=UPI001DC63F70|nr:MULTISPECIES: glycoside hydrolase family 3 C-terminal domain-containing protein [unclassified Pedobacter]CAH0263368.1 Xylan 1,4-beta-xylosidase [Pedobacter sp. Bi36]CAH0290000.1 Xylan 1,4-beta-xylosidase [Pedobacter sp. Bi126]
MRRLFFLTIFTTLVLLHITSPIQAQEYPFEDYKLPFDKRVDDLVSRLTLEEKVFQMLNSAPAIPRLKIPAYDWWNETLHGVARTPFKVTVYPQAIAMAAMFDPAALAKMADYSALEGRAIYNKAVALGRTNERYLGLTYWTPNINIFRDPRWGRGQETYGEDPYLTATLGDAFVRGLQGDDPKYLKAAACAKHYAVHSGPEPLRHVFNADVSAFDLWDTYLPAFEKLVTKSEVAGVMCAYNAFQGQPCCGSDLLMTDILRKKWGFKGYVTSDCWAIDDFFKNHKTHKDAASASADAVFHGTDLDCGTDAYKALLTAVKNGIITEKDIDVSVKRLFMIRFRLGMFDPPSMVKYANAPITVLENSAHKAHALKMARASMVLLKNESNTLPLKKNLKKLVVLGPNANNDISVLGNYNGIPSTITTVLQGIKDKLGNQTEVIYEQAISFASDTILHYRNLENQLTAEGHKGFKAEYYKGIELQGAPFLTRFEESINHNWQEGEQIGEGLAANHFSARFSTVFKALKSEEITFEVDGDDGYRLKVNGQKVLDAWSKNRWGAKTYKIPVSKDSTYKIEMEYWQGEGGAKVRFAGGTFGRTDFTELVARHRDADAFIFVGGISPQLEGEEMKVNVPGFNGGDRTSIMLPQAQTSLMKALKSSGKPVVFVMMTGSAIAIPWEAENIPAIVNAWYGGQSAGTAVADLLFGDYSPSGRLPVTFYKSDEDLKDFNDYNMENRTYRYFKGKPLFGFGYGLSYSTFNYHNFILPSKLKSGKGTSLSVKITNTGKMQSDEVAQLYVMHNNLKIKSAKKALKGYQRVSLAPGESKLVHFKLSPDELSYIDDKGTKRPLKGEITLSIGGSQPDEKLKTSGNIVTRKLIIN